MNTKNIILIAGALGSHVAAVHAGSRASANYSVVADTTDAGGRHTVSTTYAMDASVGGIAGVSSVADPAETVKAGYIAQLFEVVGFALTSAAPSVNEGAVLQLSAGLVLDDATRLAVPPTNVAWDVQSGPLVGISATGLATAGGVYEDSTAVARGIYLGQTGTLSLTVKNIHSDDFGIYAGDGLDDSWQVQYFGLNSPQASPGADPDGDGEINSDEFSGLTDPTNASSNAGAFFRITSIVRSGGNLVISFSTVVGRTYTLQRSDDLASASWTNTGLPGPVPGTGTVRSFTIPIPGVGGGEHFYRVQVGP